MTFYTYEDLSASTLGFLQVLRLVRRNPEPAYDVRCSNCGTETVMKHVALRQGTRCRNPQCSLIAERKAAQTARDLNSPVAKDFSECPPLDPKSYDVWVRMRDERLRNT